jgi:hypothetical protein
VRRAARAASRSPVMACPALAIPLAYSTEIMPWVPPEECSLRTARQKRPRQRPRDHLRADGPSQSSEHLRQYRSVSVAASGFCGPPGFGPFSPIQAGICEAEAGFGLNLRVTDVITDLGSLLVIVDRLPGLPQVGVAAAQARPASSLRCRDPRSRGRWQGLLVVLDRLPGLPQVGVAAAQASQRPSLLRWPIAGDGKGLLVVLDRPPGLPQIRVPAAEVSSAVPSMPRSPISRAMAGPAGSARPPARSAPGRRSSREAAQPGPSLLRWPISRAMAGPVGSARSPARSPRSA